MSEFLAKPHLYFAASLFSARELYYNACLCALFETAGTSVFLPQRDGLLFTTLGKSLSSFPDKEIDTVVRNLIYLQDILRLSEATAVIACLDEPVDTGVTVEMCTASELEIPVIGYRTDRRSPFGSYKSDGGGTHPFVVVQSDIFMRLRELPNEKDSEALERLFQALLEQLTQVIGRSPSRYFANHGGKTLKFISIAKTLFWGIDKPLSTLGIAELVKRYLDHKESIDKLFPTIIHIK